MFLADSMKNSKYKFSISSNYVISSMNPCVDGEPDVQVMGEAVYFQPKQAQVCIYNFGWCPV